MNLQLGFVFVVLNLFEEKGRKKKHVILRRWEKAAVCACFFLFMINFDRGDIYTDLPTRWCRSENPTPRHSSSSSPFYECKLVFFYGVPIIVDLQMISRRADEHDRFQSLRCLRCTVNVATIQEFREFLCVNEYSLLWVRGREKKNQAIL